MFVSLLTTDQQQQNEYDHFPELSCDITELHPEQDTTVIIVDNPLNTNEKVVLNKEDTRETWSNNCDYLITTLGGLIGLGKYF
jgi:hypothetical protein